MAHQSHLHRPLGRYVPHARLVVVMVTDLLLAI